MKSLTIKVVWNDQHSVNVVVSPRPLEPVRSDVAVESGAFIPDTDIRTREEFIGYLRDLTRGAAKDGTINVNAWEHSIDQIYDVLGVSFPPPDPITVDLPAKP
jgi:hypothetical protein